MLFQPLAFSFRLLASGFWPKTQKPFLGTNFSEQPEANAYSPVHRTTAFTVTAFS
jgi:hypothetical protein